MSGGSQTWLVASREMRERVRTRAFRISLAVMVLAVVSVIVLPSLISTGSGPKDVGLTGTFSGQLADTIEAHGHAVGVTTRVRIYSSLDDAEAAVRNGGLDVLVVDGNRLEWRHRVDEQLQAVVVGALQLLAVSERAAAAGVDADTLAEILTPVSVDNIELGLVAGRSPDDETATFVMTLILFMAITTYGSLVLTGVVEEKANRVVEVLLARMPARSLLAGKVTGIGLLGLAQIGVTALAAVVAISVVDSFDVPAARGAVIAWAVVWFVLGFALYAMAYGTLGALTSRPEDAQSVAGPVTVVLIIAYFGSFATTGDPDTVWATVLSFFPPTAPLAMPARIAMGAAAWWEPVAAAVVTVAAIFGLVRLGGRLYDRAILRTGPTLKLRDVWRADAR